MVNTMYLKITEACNMSCPFCYIKHKNNVITKDIIKTTMEKYNPKNVIFHGGEPLLYPSLINYTMNNYDKEYSIVTNLTLDLENEQKDILNKIPVTTSYSVDRFNNATWNKFVENCGKIKISTIIVTITEKQLEEDVYLMVDKLLKLNPKYITLERCYGNYDKEFYNRTDDYIMNCMDVIPEEKNTLLKDIKYSIIHNQLLYDTKCSNNIITINPDGSEQHCPTKKDIEKPLDCNTCELYPYCKNDCECFRGFCKFPKKAFNKILDKKEDLFKKDRIKKWLDNNVLTNKTYLYELALTIADVCNRKCSFCPRGNGYKNHYTDNFMSIDLITKICNDLGKDYCGLFSLSGFGEPTLHPQLHEFISTIQTLCPKSNIMLITNGDNIDKLVGLHNISIAFSMYEQFDENKLNQIKELGCEYIIKDIEHKNKNYFNNRAGNTGKVLNESLHQCCNLPFYKMSIDNQGKVISCCSDWNRENIMGDVNKENIYDIWNNEKYRILRSNLVLGRRDLCKLCCKCDTNGLLAGKEFVDFWRLYVK